MGTCAAIALGIGGAAAGAIGGAQDKVTRSSGGLLMDPASELENQARRQSHQGLRGIQEQTAQGNELLQQLIQSGGMPGQQDIQASQGFAQNIFDPQRLAMQQNFQDQRTQANQAAAISGRGANDPILRARLAQEQTRQQALLGAQQGGFASQLALAMPGQRLGYQQQAIQNQMALFGAGNQALQSERNFRVASADRWGEQVQEGSLAGAISGGFSGAASGVGVASGFQNLLTQQKFGGLLDRLKGQQGDLFTGGSGLGGSSFLNASNQVGQIPNMSAQSGGDFSQSNPLAFGGQGGTLLPATRQQSVPLGNFPRTNAYLQSTGNYDQNGKKRKVF